MWVLFFRREWNFVVCQQPEIPSCFFFKLLEQVFWKLCLEWVSPPVIGHTERRHDQVINLRRLSILWAVTTFGPRPVRYMQSRENVTAKFGEQWWTGQCGLQHECYSFWVWKGKLWPPKWVSFHVWVIDVTIFWEKNRNSDRFRLTYSDTCSLSLCLF